MPWVFNVHIGYALALIVPVSRMPREKLAKALPRRVGSPTWAPTYYPQYPNYYTPYTGMGNPSSYWVSALLHGAQHSSPALQAQSHPAGPMADGLTLTCLLLCCQKIKAAALRLFRVLKA